MTDRHSGEHDPGSRFEDEGIPDLQDGTPEQQEASDPQQAPLPHDQPTAVLDFGTTAEEQRRGETLDMRVAREVPDVPDAGGNPDATYPDHPDRVGRIVQPDQGSRDDTEPDAVADEVGADGGGYLPEERAMHVEEG